MTSKAFTRTLFAAAAAAATFGTFAAPLAASETSGASAASEQRPAAEPRSDDNRRICINNSTSGADTVTGSMLSRRTCRTRAQWAREGVQLPAAAN